MAKNVHERETYLLPSRWDSGSTNPDVTFTSEATPFNSDTVIENSGRPGPISSGSLTAVKESTSSVGAISSDSGLHSTSRREPDTNANRERGFVHLIPGTIVGEYEVEKLLGAGGMGAVYGARHERLRKKVAIKVIAPSLSIDRAAVERFEQEALALAQLDHPNIVSIISIGTLPGDGRSYYVMEWLDGQSLYDRMERELRLGVIHRQPLASALDIVDQIARGLDAAHVAGMVHRDLKPDNCWLQQVRGETRHIVKILDFGLAKLVEHRRSEETAANIMFGTPSYMSPEQCRSSRDVGPPTDVYALGCIAYELLCGRLPFTYDNAAELIVAHYTEAPAAPHIANRSIPLEINSLVLAMLAKDPARRPTLAQVRRVIATAIAAISMPATPPPLPHTPVVRAVTAPVTQAGSRRLMAVLAGVVVVVIVIVALAASSTDERQVDKPGVVDRAPKESTQRLPPTWPLPMTTPPTNPRMAPQVDAGVDHRSKPLRAGATAPPLRSPSDAGVTVDASIEQEPVDASEPEHVREPQVNRPPSPVRPPPPVKVKPRRNSIVDPGLK